MQSRTDIPTPKRWWQPGMVAYAGWEMLFMRAAFAFLIFTSLDWNTSEFHEQPFPNGLAHFFDLSWLGTHPPGLLWERVTMGGLVFYSIGVLPVLGLLPMLFFMICIGTLANSQGAINHSLQLVTMITLAQFACYAWSAIREKRNFLRPSALAHRLATHASLVVIAASYVVCGLVKWIASDGLWIWRAPYLSLQLLKSNWNNYYNTLEAPPQWLQTFTEFLTQYPWFTRVFFGMGLIIETGAFVIMMGRRWAFFGGVAIIALHLGISRVMSLDFETHTGAALIFLVNIPGLIGCWIYKMRPQKPKPLKSPDFA